MWNVSSELLMCYTQSFIRPVYSSRFDSSYVRRGYTRNKSMVPFSWSLALLLLLLSCFSRVRLRDPIDGSPPGSPVPGILQARTQEWVAISFSNAWKWKVKVKSLSRVRLRDPMDCSLPGSSIHEIFQARVLEWVAVAFSKNVLGISDIKMTLKKNKIE